MTRLLFTILFSSFIALSHAQLPDGSIAPDFTIVDLDGNTHSLYADYLNHDKPVFLDFFATWCPPCWTFHNSNAFKDVYNAHGPSGTDDVMLMSLEVDASTPISALYGTGNTQGNWVAGTPYPMADVPALNGLYNINYYPTIYGVCPDGTVTEIGQSSANALNTFWQSCPPLPPAAQIVHVQSAQCYGSSSGAITADASGNFGPYNFQWSNGATTKTVNNLPAGAYYCTVTGTNGGTSELGPIMVSQPTTPVSVSLANSSPSGCNGILGSATVIGSGGTGTHNYTWSNGWVGGNAFALAPGIYSVTATDGNGCTSVLSNIEITQSTVPTAVAGSDDEIDCNNVELTLNGTNSTSGANMVYVWTTNDGNIVSGVNSLEPVVDKAGTYTLTAFHGTSTCGAMDDVVITENTITPTANAGSGGTIDCITSLLTLAGSGSTGTNISYQWQTTNGNIVAGGNTLMPEVDAAGDYELIVTNNDNGCTESGLVEILQNTQSPTAGAAGGEITCNNINVTLDGNSTTANVTYQWSGPDGYMSTEEDPTVEVAGTYSLTVVGNNGCTESAEAIVDENTIEPGANATGGTIDCLNNSITLTGNSIANNVTYNWTGPDNFNSNLQNPETGVTGTYDLLITGDNGCTSESITEVLENTTTPTASAGDDEKLDCNNATVFLDGSASSAGANYTYSWTTSNGNILVGATTLQPEVNAIGTYDLLVTNTDNGCTETAIVEVTESPSVELEITNQVNVNCHGNANGSSMANASGGVGNFTFSWSNGETTPAIANLVAGNYTVTVTDEDGCSKTDAVEITQPNSLEANASTTGVTSLGGTDGTASAEPTGGTEPFTYSWSNGMTTQTIEDLAPGNYSVVVKDANDCERTQTVTVNSFTCSIAVSGDGTDVSCFGANNGEAEVDLQNTVGAIEYNWSNGETTATISNLEPGNYTVTATDETNCEISAEIAITEPQVLNVNATSTDLTFVNADDGTANAAPTGGTGNYTYQWSNGESTAQITNLPVGEYTVTILDDNGCEEIQTVNVAPFGCALMVDLVSDNISCNGANDGTATITIQGGTLPYSYEWSTGSTEQTIEDLTAGAYSVIGLDVNGCPYEQVITITEPVVITTEITDNTPAECEEDQNGAVTVQADGGVGNFTYAWSNGATGETAENLAVGTYTVIAEDENGCTESLEVAVDFEDLELPTVLVQDIILPLNTNGLAELTPEMIDNGSFDNCDISTRNIDQSNFDCAVIGTYEVTLTIEDVNGNVNSAIANVTVADEMAPEVLAQDVTLTLDENGVANLTAEMINNGSTDNCEIESITIDTENFTCNEVGENEVTLTITDIHGNVGMATAMVSVMEEEAPTISVMESITLELNADGMATLTPAEVDLGSTDNCGIETLNLSIQEFSCNTIGDNQVLFSAIDFAGNANSQMITVNIVDNTVPTMGCPGDIQAIDCEHVVNYDMPTVIDNCEVGTPELVAGLESGSIFPVGITLITWQYVDNGGNTVGCSFSVNTPDFLSVEEIQSSPITCNGDTDGALTAIPAGGVSGYQYEWSDGQTTQVATNLSADEYTVTITDANGCEIVETHILEEPDPIEIMIGNVENDINMQNVGSINIVVEGGVGPYTFNWILGGNTISNDQNPEGLGAGDYIVEVTDVNGCLVASEEITVDNVTGVQEPDWAKALILTPNPSNGKFNLSLPNLSELAQIEIFTVIGQEINMNLNQAAFNNYQIELDDTANGVYLIQITVANEAITRRMVVNQ